jgi:hypothetical protein
MGGRRELQRRAELRGPSHISERSLQASECYWRSSSASFLWMISRRWAVDSLA